MSNHEYTEAFVQSGRFILIWEPRYGYISVQLSKLDAKFIFILFWKNNTKYVYFFKNGWDFCF